MNTIVTLEINGDRQEVAVPEHWTLLEALRYGLRLTGSKQGCDKGDCGACTVLLDGVPVLACITPVGEAEGHAITTVEGLARPGALHPLQQAFAEAGAAQCGFCTPGILMSALGLLRANPAPTRADIKDALAGNLCRCTGYTKIIEAVERAAERLRGAGPERQSGGVGEGRSGGDSASAGAAAAAPDGSAGSQSVRASECQRVSHSASSEVPAAAPAMAGAPVERPDANANADTKAAMGGAPVERPNAKADADANAAMRGTPVERPHADADAGGSEGRGRPDSRSDALTLSRSPE